MEILNQNQRRSAMWRIVALGVFILSLFGTVLYSMHNSYASLGMDDFETLKTKYEKEQQQWEGEKKGLTNKMKKLQKDLDDCEKGSSKPNEKLELCEARMNLLREQLSLCESRSATSGY